MRCVGAVQAVLGLVVLIAVAVTPGAARGQIAGPWGACGRGTAEEKVVRVVPSAQGDLVLRCGGPRWAPDPNTGYRHILWRHLEDFKREASGTNQNWRDVADLAMRSLASDPDAIVPYDGDQTCRSRVIFLYDLRTNQVAKQRIFRMFTDNTTNNINSVFPARSQC